jgi:hypothetical protein
VGTAVAIAAYRLYRKQPVRHAVNGLVGIALGAYLAYRSGDPKQFYLPGILLALGQSAVLLGSVVIRRPLIGYVWAIVAAGGKHASQGFGIDRVLGTAQRDYCDARHGCSGATAGS